MTRGEGSISSVFGFRPAPDTHGMHVLYALIALCTIVELVLQLGQRGLIDVPRLRSVAYENGAFWPGLMRDWLPNYPGQPWLMYITYGFLHGGLLHLLFNMLTLWSLGIAILERVSTARFLILYFGSMFGGGAVFALLSTSAQPMVGASGALFGLAGAVLAWLWEDQPTLRMALRFAGRAVLILLAFNIVLHFLLAGQLAWETHLGGFLTGWVLAIALNP
ncbi:MAG: rhomboid family intramembrane serine protease, partial [Pseudomonadota bacterium]